MATYSSATREVLEPLAEMANRLHIAVVAVTHLNKGGGGGNQTALNRFSGSIAFIAAARAAFSVLEDPENDERRFLLQAKNNLGPKCKGLVFRMEQRVVSEGIVSSNIIFFENEQVSQSIDEALTASENRGGDGSQTSGKEDVAEFLTEVLAAGPVDVLEVERRARLAGLLGDDKRIRENKSPCGSQASRSSVQARRFRAGVALRPEPAGSPMCAQSTHRRPLPAGGAHGESGRT